MQLKVVAFSILSSLLAAAQNTTVFVGSAPGAQGAVLQFTPSTINATTGSTITFKWNGTPGNHTVTQSSFSNPCAPLAGGFDSGYVFTPASGVSHTPEWNLTITNGSEPIWFFCKQIHPGPHCQAGMVGAINAPTSGHTFSAFLKAAKAFNGTINQAEGGLVGQGASASSLPGPITGGASFYTAPAATGATAAPTATGSRSGALRLGMSSFWVAGGVLSSAFVLL